MFLYTHKDAMPDRDIDEGGSVIQRRWIGLVLSVMLGVYGGYAQAGTAAATPHGIKSDLLKPLIRYPTVHGQKVVFEAGGNLWQTSLNGGVATQLTSDSGFDASPHFSPDGQWIAFTGWYQGNTDVYVMPSGGGPVKRLTYHSINNKVGKNKLKTSHDNTVLGWTPDSRKVVFLSRRDSFNPQVMHAYTVPVGGGLPKRLPLPWTGPLSFGGNDHTVAYNKLSRGFRSFHRKHYYGGQAQDIWTYDFNTGKSQRITYWKGADTWPMWHADTIYFTSDRGRHHIQNLWSYSLKSRQFQQLTHFSTYDIDRPTLGDQAIAFSDGGDLYVYSIDSGRLDKVAVQVPMDGHQLQPRWVDASPHIASVDVAPNGKIAVFSARGALFTVPAKYGSTQNLTTTDGVDQRDPAWSPDGKQIAFIGSRDSANEIYLRSASGGTPRALTHTDRVSYQPPITWSPDGRWITYVDSTQTLWIQDVESGKRWRVAQDKSHVRGGFADLHWSPGSDWLAFSKTLPNRISGLFLYHIVDQSLHRISGGRYNDHDPVFSSNGKYLFFVSDRIVNPAVSNFDFTVAGLNSGGLYAATLSKSALSPVAPRVRHAVPSADDTAKSDDSVSRKTKMTRDDQSQGNSSSSDKHKGPLHIDVVGLMSRAVRLPVPSADIAKVFEAKGVVYYLVKPSQILGDEPLAGRKTTLHAYDLKKRKGHTLVTDVHHLVMSADGTTFLYQTQGKWTLRPATFKKEPDPDTVVTLDLDHVRRQIQPRAEWRTIFGEAMRDVRDYFVDPELIDRQWAAIDARYSRLLPRATSRDDVNWLIGNAIGSLGESHMYVYGGDEGWKSPARPSADLGVEFALDSASRRYYLNRIYQGDNTVPGYGAPMAQPGLKVKPGDFVLAINGRTLKAPTNPYALLNGTYGNTISLKIADDAAGKNARIVYVKPIANAHKLHLLAWIRHNRQRVAQLSDGHIGYVYLEDMEATGMREFVRQYYSQMGKQAILFDDRWNLGGYIDPVLFDRVGRRLNAMFTNRHRWTDPTPNAPAGYMAALINRGSASDGDIFAYMFKKNHLGPTIGSRTWGGVRGYYTPFKLLDGGHLVVSESAMYGLDSQWVIENIGVSPDVAVHDEPGELMHGHDAQLQTAVHVLMKKITHAPRQYPPPPAWIPAFPPQPDYPACVAGQNTGTCD